MIKITGNIIINGTIAMMGIITAIKSRLTMTKKTSPTFNSHIKYWTVAYPTAKNDDIPSIIDE